MLAKVVRIRVVLVVVVLALALVTSVWWIPTSREPVLVARRNGAAADSGDRMGHPEEVLVSGERVPIQEPPVPDTPRLSPHWRNPHRENAGFRGVGDLNQKYHSSAVDVRPVDEAWVREMEGSELFNPEGVVLTDQDRESLRENAGSMVLEVIAAKRVESDLTKEATRAKVAAHDFAETIPNPPEARATVNLRQVVGKHQGADRFVSVHSGNDQIGVVVVTENDAPDAIAARRGRAAAYDRLVEFLFSYFEDVTNR